MKLWIDGWATMKNDLSYHNLSVEDATELALDRPLWRLLAASGATHWNGASWTMMMMMMMMIMIMMMMMWLGHKTVLLCLLLSILIGSWGFFCVNVNFVSDCCVCVFAFYVCLILFWPAQLRCCLELFTLMVLRPTQPSIHPWLENE